MRHRTATTSAEGYTLDMTIDSFGNGEYTADGEKMEVFNLIDLFVTVDVGGLGGAAFDGSEFGAVAGSGTYVCTADDVEVTIPEGTVRWIRVDKILEPPQLDSSGE